MKLQKKYLFICYLAGLVILLGIKLYYSQAGADQLKWILAPTAKWVTLLSGIPFSYEKGAGYVNHDLRLLIAASCSGVQFMLITYAMLAFTFLKRFTRLPAAFVPRFPGRIFGQGHGSIFVMKGFSWILVSLLLSCLLTILINGLRIIAALHLPRFLESRGLLFSYLTPGRLHTAIGTMIYFLALLNIYQVMDFIFRKADNSSCRTQKYGIQSRQSDGFPHSEKNGSSLPENDSCGAKPDTIGTILQILRKCASPVFWYFFMVLGLPFLNQAYEKGESRFTAFALLITLCCGIVLLLHILLSLLRKILRKRLLPISVHK